MQVKITTHKWVFLRGLVRESRHWGDFVDQFATDLKLLGHTNPHKDFIFFDLPGVGSKSGQPFPLNPKKAIEDLNQELEEKIHHNNRKPVSFIGVSLGALIGLNWQAIYPGRFKKMVLVNTSHSAVSPSYKRLRFDHVAKKILHLVKKESHASEKAILDIVSNDETMRASALQSWVEIKDSSPWGLKNLVEQLAFAIRAKDLPDPPCKNILFAASIHDRLVHMDCTVALMSHLRSKGVFHPTAGHDLTLDDPQWLSDEISSWLVRTAIKQGS